ncbi:MAG: DNA translocase FtsK 4TM domain-containing protein, partial [Chloroflexota bacterium]
MTKRSTRRASPRKRQTPPVQLSRAQVSWIVGLALWALALVTLLSVVSQTRGLLTGRWLNLLADWFGVGAYLIPIGLAILGVWIIMLGTAHPIQPPWRRTVGIVLLYWTVLALIHHLADPARQGQVARLGGQLGALPSHGLTQALGWVGALVVLLLLAGIGLILALSVNAAELLADTLAGLRRAWDWLHSQWQGLRRPSPLAPRTP